MNVFTIAWRSIQHRGLGSWLTIISMALGVMLVVAVLSIHGMVSQSFRSNSSFGYNVLVGARGGGLQLTLNTVYYLSKPVENIPYAYYLAFCDPQTRQEELQHSIAWQASQLERDTLDTALAGTPGSGGFASLVTSHVLSQAIKFQNVEAMRIDKPGMYRRFTHVAVPLCLGDYYVDEDTGAAFRCVGTNPDFFSELVLDVDTEAQFEFAQGRSFVTVSEENGFYECVIGAQVARRCGLKLGDTIMPTHGDPNSANAHLHETPFAIVGILEPTGTPNDRVLFLNMEGFYLMEGHNMEIDEEQTLKTEEDDEEADPATLVDPFADEEDGADESVNVNEGGQGDGGGDRDGRGRQVSSHSVLRSPAADTSTLAPLPIEQREVTSIFVRTSKNDPYGMLALLMPAQINQGDLENTLGWTAYRPNRAQKAAQAVNPVDQVTGLFQQFVDPVRWLLLALTFMICVVAGLSILVGIYNSMNQRRSEIAIMRALGANRGKVMSIMLCEAILLALAGGFLGWIAGHGLNAAVGPLVESQTGVSVGFFSFAPGIPLGEMFGGSLLPAPLVEWSISPELLLIPGLMLLAVVVGIYPAFTAYRTDVSQSLGK